MLFNSLHFLLFFPTVFILYSICPKRFRCVFLLTASYYFYLSFNLQYGLLMVYVTVLTYFGGNRIGKLREQGDSGPAAKRILAVCMILLFLMLVWFKYSVFFWNTIRQGARIFGIPIPAASWRILLPVGISFYTFQAAGYMIDIYHGRTEPERNFFRYALFVSFFPQLVAGPIERSGSLLKQIRNLDRIPVFSYERITDGLVYMLYGYFLKLVIADRIAIPVDYVFEHYASYSGFISLLGAVCFSIQIYCDFSAYSAIAIGSAQVFGIRLMENFHAPYLYGSIQEFWRNWHISLSAWFRDYVYIPLGGNRGSRLKRWSRILITFLVSGLWHGAGWNFVVWGGIHGVLQITEDLLEPAAEKIRSRIDPDGKNIFLATFRSIRTFGLCTFAWIFFRGSDLHHAAGIIYHIVGNFSLNSLTNKKYMRTSLNRIGLNQIEETILLISLLFLLAADIALKQKQLRFDKLLNRIGPLPKGFVILCLLLAIGIFGIYGFGYDASEFIYFQF